MKKFILGALCGVILSTTTTALAATTIKTVLTNASLEFHINGKTDTVNSDEVALLNFDSRIYVPLRLFAEKMGATVDYIPGKNQPHVNVYFEDNDNFTIMDSSNSVGIGHVNVDFGNKADMNDKKPTITGTIKLLKALPANKEVILELKEKSGKVIAQSETIQAGGKSLSQFQVGDVRSFSVNFPYTTPISDYQIGIKIIDSSAWKFKQSGVNAQQDSPFDITLATDHDLSMPVKQGSTLNLIVTIINTSDRALKISNAQIGIILPSNDGDIIQSTEVLKNTMIPGNNGSMTTSIPWKVTVPANRYSISLKDPIQFEYEDEGKTKKFETMSDMQSAFPIIVE